MLGIVFVLLVCFLRRGIVGGVMDLARLAIRKAEHGTAAESDPPAASPSALSAAENRAPIARFDAFAEAAEARR